MEKLKQVLKEIDKMIIVESGDKIHQTQRNEIKSKLMQGTYESLKGNGLQVERVTDGITLEVENADFGSIFVTLDIKVRNTDYDILTETKEYNDKVAEQQEKAEKKASEKKARAEKNRKKPE